MTKKSIRENLVHHVQELEHLEEKKALAGQALNDAFKAAAAAGFDQPTLKAVLKLRKLTPAQRRDRRALEAIYLASLGMLEGEPLPDEARRRLDEKPPASPAETPERKKGDRRSELGAKPKEPEKPPVGQIPMNLKDPAEARQEGRTGAAAGKRIYDNPYPAGDPCRAAWDEGWCEESGSHGMDTPSAYQRRTEKPPDPPPAEDGKAA